MNERIPLPIWIILLAFVGCQTQKMTADEALLNPDQMVREEMATCPKNSPVFKKMKDPTGESLICAKKQRRYLHNVVILYKVKTDKTYHVVEKKDVDANFQFIDLNNNRFALTQVMFVPIENKFYHAFPLETSVYHGGFLEDSQLCPTRWPKGIYTGTADYVRKNHSTITVQEQASYAKKLFAETLDGNWKARRILMDYSDWFSLNTQSKETFEFYKNLFVQLEAKKCVSYQKLSFPFAI